MKHKFYRTYIRMAPKDDCVQPQPSLSNRQREILGYIEQFVDQHNYPPAIRQIQEDLGISSTSVVVYNLNILEQRGMLRREGKVSRGISISKVEAAFEANANQVPFLGTITVVSPLPDPEDLSSGTTEYIDVPPEVVPSNKLANLYALKGS